MQLYDWQRQVIDSYNGSGTVKAVTAAGKSLVGKEIIKKLGGNVIVASHRKSILDQWKEDLKEIPHIQFLTFNILCKNSFNNINLLLIDEAHRSTSEEFIKLYDNVDYKNILGLTATPDDKTIDMCGELICDIGYDQANVSKFNVIFQGIELNNYERQKYRELSYKISSMMQIESPTQEEKAILRNIIIKRRSVVYQAQSRVPTAIGIIYKKWKEGHKILVICQRIEQVEKISMILSGIPHIIYHSKHKDDLDKYKSGKVRLCLSVGMLKEGFNDPDTDVGVIVSTTLSESFNVQSIGRVIRFRPYKQAQIYILLANRTSDTKVIQHAKDVGYESDNINIIEPPDPELHKKYYSGIMYGFSMGEVWKKTRTGRQYMQHHDIIKKLQRIKPAGGRFSITDDGVYTKIENRVIKVSDEHVTFVPVAEKREVDVEDLFGEI